VPSTAAAPSAPSATSHASRLQNSKHITCGDGGVVGSSDERFGPFLQKWGDKGGNRSKWGGFDGFATNYRMSEPQAAVAAAQLTRLEEIAEKRSRLGKTTDGAHRRSYRESSPTTSIRKTGMSAGSTCSASAPRRSKWGRSRVRQGAQGRGRLGSLAGTSSIRSTRSPSSRTTASSPGRWPVKEMGLDRHGLHQA
jgi:perosamine synthetase